jgi:hypothetical protein
VDFPHPALQQNSRAKRGSVRCKGGCWRRAILGSASVTRPLIPLRSTANPFEWAHGPHRALPRLRLYYELVRLPYRHTSALPFVSLLEASRRSGTALPSSDANRWITCHGLRPRPDTTPSPNRVPCCWLPGHETLGPAATMNITGLDTFTCVVADNPPSLWLHVIRYLLTRKALFWPGG